MCIYLYRIVIRPVFNPMYKQNKQVNKYICVLYHGLVLFLQSRIFSAMYQSMRSKGLSWTGLRQKTKRPPLTENSDYKDGDLEEGDMLDEADVEILSSFSGVALDLLDTVTNKYDVDK